MTKLSVMFSALGAVLTASGRSIAIQKARGGDTGFSEELLTSYEQTQVIFEDDLARIGRECGKAGLQLSTSGADVKTAEEQVWARTCG